MSLIILGIVSIVLVLLIIGTANPATRPDGHTEPDLENPPRYVRSNIPVDSQHVCYDTCTYTNAERLDITHTATCWLSCYNTASHMY